MFSCDHLYHPFLNDPGTSQDERLPAALVADSPAIDNREISDFLNYFAALSHQINFYDSSLNVSDWGPFFSGDLAFFLSSMAATDTTSLNTTLESYTKMFEKRPTVEGLQLIFLYTWYSIVYPIQQWAGQLQNSGLPLETNLQTLITDRLPAAIRSFISWMNTAVKCFCIRPIDPGVLLVNSAWGLAAADLTAYDEEFSCTGKSSRTQLLALQSSLNGLSVSFLEVLDLAGSGAADQVNQELYSLLLTTGQQTIRPHLALLYSFLNQYLNLLDDLNNLTDRHLNFFFQDVLQLAPGAVIADQAYVIFSLQKQVPNYPLPAGLSLKDGKDNKNADVYFALDDPIVVTQTQATAFKTLFVNTPSISAFFSDGTALSYVEGVYMAPDATKSDGLTQPFTNPATASWPTLGAKQSEYTPPMAQSPVDYPSARLGFILASKVLFLNEGVRRVRIHLACRLASACDATTIFTPEMARVFIDAFSSRWLIITQDLIDKAIQMGLSPEMGRTLQRHYLEDRCRSPICKDDDQPAWLPYRLIEIPQEKGERSSLLFTKEVGTRFGMEQFELDIWNSLLQPQPVLTLAFSGAKAWLAPKYTDMYIEVADPFDGTFNLHIHAAFGKEQDAVTFYDKSVLGEDFNTTDPLVKIQLNDNIKISLDLYLAAAGLSTDAAIAATLYELKPPVTKAPPATTLPQPDCCLVQPDLTCGKLVSFYTFFRNVIVLGPGTGIHVTVCGVKNNVVVQNDDNVLSVKKPFTPFGVKPIVPDFDPLRKPPPMNAVRNLVGPNFYIGSVEIFLKKWHRINVNINWKGVPAHLRHYYRAYFKHPADWPFTSFPQYQVNLAVLHDGNWSSDSDAFGNPYVSPNPITNHLNRPFFDQEDQSVGDCDSQATYKYCFDLRPKDFNLNGQLRFDPTFAPLTSYSNGVLNGYLRLTMENQDFMHRFYPTVMAEKMIARAHWPYAHIALPNEPWTPTILDLSLDYEAHAGSDDIQLIQLYPYDGTYNKVDINGEPFLFATFCDEGNLFIALTGLVPGDGLNILFQLAEATAETEGGSATVNWQYLASNQWQALRPGFNVVQDSTNGLSTTGIVQYDFPDDIGTDNTVMPAGSAWIWASAPANAEAASQTLAIVTQAALASFVNNTALNDQTRPGNIPLVAGSISKLTTPDPNLSGVSQPYDSFGGHAPEALNNDFALRVSEQLRHKGRAIQKWDYERIVLQEFPKILRAKCITHSYALNSGQYRWDFPMSPGNILLAVLPDPAQLAVADSYQPTVPMSMLTQIEISLAAVASPFVRIFVRNPRYELVDMCMKLSLAPNLNAKYCQALLQQDISKFMAPWLDGNIDAFQFAQRLYTSDLIQFIEGLDYVRNLLHLEMCHHGDSMQATTPDFIDPLTPRSILVAGKIVVHMQETAKNKLANGRNQ
jgi:hypothetical protein